MPLEIHLLTLIYSHSTMYLLKPNACGYSHSGVKYSHSTMYLLKRLPFPRGFLIELTFTFHHVSIKTLNVPPDRHAILKFTFHHVSIKTLKSLIKTISDLLFTFHHVSIKTNTIKKQYFTMLSYPLSVDLASILGIHFLFFNCIFHFSIFHHIVD